MDDQVHLLFFTPALGGGGAQKHLLRLINHLDREKFRLSLALAKSGGSYEVDLAADVRVHALDTGRVNSSTLRMIRSIQPLRRLILVEQPDILCPVMDHVNLAALQAIRGLPQPPKIILNSQTPPSTALQQSRNIVKRLTLALIPRLYPRADCVVALSQGVAKDLLYLVPELHNSVEVIYNAGLDAEVLAGAQETIPETESLPEGPLIVACGRLIELKGFSYLIETMTQIRPVVPAHLWIIGEGKQRPYLEKRIRELDLTHCVRLLGFQANPFTYMAAADVFVLSSLFEGFGNVIVEAMACGTAVVATDCPYGPAEIIEDRVNGLLVSPANTEALAQGILQVLTDPDLKQRLAACGQVRAQDFSAARITASYQELFLRVANGC